MRYIVETSDSIESFDSLHEAMDHVKTLKTKDYEVYPEEGLKMGNTYTEAQKRASLKYQADKAQIKITVDKALRDKWQKHAESKNTTITALITELLNKECQ